MNLWYFFTNKSLFRSCFVKVLYQRNLYTKYFHPNVTRETSSIAKIYDSIKTSLVCNKTRLKLQFVRKALIFSSLETPKQTFAEKIIFSGDQYINNVWTWCKYHLLLKEHRYNIYIAFGSSLSLNVYTH